MKGIIAYCISVKASARINEKNTVIFGYTWNNKYSGYI